MPVYNGEKYVKEAIQSILDQTFKDFELLIINDGSTDASQDIIESFNDKRIRLINNEQNIKLISTLNKGLDAARGEWIARQDCDDISLPDRLKKQMDFLFTNTEVHLLGARVSMIDDEGNTIQQATRPVSHFQNKWSLLFATTIMHSSVIFRKKTIQELGGYSSLYLHAEDFALWSSLVNKYQVHQLEDTLVCLRKHDQSIGAKYNLIQQEMNVDIGCRNINLIQIKGLQESDIIEAIQIYRGIYQGSINARKFYKTFVAIYSGFLEKNNLISKDDRKWIANNLIMKINRQLMKLNIPDQISLLIWSIMYPMNGGKHIFFKTLGKKYMHSLLH